MTDVGVKLSRETHVHDNGVGVGGGWLRLQPESIQLDGTLAVSVQFFDFVPGDGDGHCIRLP
ncbi:hypothetical protein D3C72_2414440 [compost metagenome]